MKASRCPKCESEMESGFVVDRRHNNIAGLPNWAAGEPERNWIGGLKLRGRKRYVMRTTRCRRCGYLESWATEPASS